MGVEIRSKPETDIQPPHIAIYAFVCCGFENVPWSLLLCAPKTFFLVWSLLKLTSYTLICVFKKATLLFLSASVCTVTSPCDRWWACPYSSLCGGPEPADNPPTGSPLKAPSSLRASHRLMGWWLDSDTQSSPIIKGRAGDHRQRVSLKSKSRKWREIKVTNPAVFVLRQ